MSASPSVPLVVALLGFAVPAAAQGSLFVTDRNGDRVLRYDVAGGSAEVFSADGGLDNPVGLTFGSDGHLRACFDWAVPPTAAGTRFLLRVIEPAMCRTTPFVRWRF